MSKSQQNEIYLLKRYRLKGIDLKNIQGTGEGGRITKKDLDSLSSEDANMPSEKINLPKIIAEESYDESPVSQMRKTISKRLSESKFTAPHFYLTMEINMDLLATFQEILTPMQLKFTISQNHE